MNFVCPRRQALALGPVAAAAVREGWLPDEETPWDDETLLALVEELQVSVQ